MQDIALVAAAIGVGGAGDADDVWRTPNSLKDSNVSPSERQRKREESGGAP